MGQTWHAPAGAPRPAHRMGLCRAGHALRHRRHGGAPHRDQCRRRSRRPCGADRRSGRLALTPKLAIPDNITVLALPPRSPELNPEVWQFMRDNWLSNQITKTLPSLEQPHRPTMEDHVPRHAQMGAWVLINDRWYKRDWSAENHLRAIGMFETQILSQPICQLSRTRGRATDISADRRPIQSDQRINSTFKT